MSLQKGSKGGFGRLHLACELLVLLQMQGACTWRCNIVRAQQPCLQETWPGQLLRTDFWPTIYSVKTTESIACGSVSQESCQMVGKKTLRVQISFLSGSCIVLSLILLPKTTLQKPIRKKQSLCKVFFCFRRQWSGNKYQLFSKASACKAGGGEERQEGDSGLEEGGSQVGGDSQENLSHRHRPHTLCCFGHKEAAPEISVANCGQVTLGCRVHLALSKGRGGGCRS